MVAWVVELKEQHLAAVTEMLRRKKEKRRG
jgi:hypothetical protein